MKSIGYATGMVTSSRIRLTGIPLTVTILFAGLLVLSYLVFGSVSPPNPQTYGNAGYQKLWTGDLTSAVAAFQRALDADPAFPYRWSDLGEALKDAGRTGEARYSFRRAMELAPESPEIALRVSNFYFQSGAVDEAISLDSRILAHTGSYDPMIFRTWMRMGVGVAHAFDSGIGANPRAGKAFFDFLATNGHSADLSAAWGWLDSRGYATPRQGREWVDALLGSGASAEAADIWAKHVAQDSSNYRKTNWIDDSGFERDWSGGGFDWNSAPCSGVRVSVDNTVAHSGSRSLRLDLNVDENLDFHHFSQRTWIPPGRYRLEGWIRTNGFIADRGIDQGIGLRAWDPSHPSELSVFTPGISGTNGWQRVARDFVVAGHPRLMEIQVVRRPSWSFDNHPRGTAWIDDVRVLPLP